MQPCKYVDLAGITQMAKNFYYYYINIIIIIRFYMLIFFSVSDSYSISDFLSHMHTIF